MYNFMDCVGNCSEIEDTWKREEQGGQYKISEFFSLLYQTLFKSNGQLLPFLPLI